HWQSLAGRFRPDELSDRFDFGEQIAGAFARAWPIKRWRIYSIERTRAHRLEDLRAVIRYIGSYNQNWAGTARHYLASRLNSIDCWHDEVHQNEVRRIVTTLFDCLMSINSGPGNGMLTTALDHPADRLGSHWDVINNRDSHGPASP